MTDSTTPQRINVGNIVRTIEQDGVPTLVRGTVVSSTGADRMAKVLWPDGAIVEYFHSDLIVEAQNIQKLVAQQHDTRDKDLRELSLEALKWAKENDAVPAIREVFARQGVGIPTDRYRASFQLEFWFEGTLTRTYSDSDVDEEAMPGDLFMVGDLANPDAAPGIDWDRAKWQDVTLDEFQTTCKNVFMIDEEGEPVL